MYFFYYFTIIFVLSVAVNSEVVEYSDDVFKSKIAQHKNALVMFYMPWCQHCKAFKPQFERAEEIARAKNLDVKFIQVNCEQGGTNTCRNYQISGYPRVKYFAKGAMRDEYEGSHNADAVARYLFNKFSK